MSLKKVGSTDAYGRRIFNDGVEQTDDTSEFEATIDVAGTTKWLQGDLSTFSTTPHALAGSYVASAGHILAGFAVPGGEAIGKILTVSGFHPDIRGDGSIPRTRFFTESFLVQENDIDDVEDQVVGPSESFEGHFGG